MREIKFRAWQPATLVYSDEYEDMETFFRRCGDLTIEQYTCLHDKNGKEIYEGDLVRVIDNSLHCSEGVVLRVCFEGGGFVLLDKDPRSWMNYYPMSQTENQEVVGNIHENPELA